jgi:hypothetical protein
MTPAGVNFIPLDDGWNVLIWPKDNDHTTGQYTVRTVNTRARAGNSADLGPDGQEIYRPLVKALRRAEEVVVENRMTLPMKNKSWRTRNQAPSDLQSGFARRLGIPAFEGMTKGRLSDEISIALCADVLANPGAVWGGDAA